MTNKSHVDKPIEHPMEVLLDLQAKLDEAEAELAGYRSVQDISTLELNELRAKIAAHETQSPKAEADPALSASIAEKDALIADLRSKLQSAAVDDELAHKANQADYFSKQLESARATISTLEEEMLKQPASNQKIVADLQGQLAEMTAELDQAREVAESQAAEIQGLAGQGQSALDEAQSLKVRIEEAEAQALAARKSHQMLSREHEELQGELSQLRQKSEIETELRDTIQELTTKFAAAQQAVVDLRRDSQNQSARRQQTLAEITDLREENEQLRTKVESLQTDLSKLSDSAQEIQRLESRLAAAAVDLEAYDDLMQAKVQLQHRAAMLEAELGETRSQGKDVTALQAELESAQTAVFELAHLRARMKAHRAALKVSLDQLDELVSGESTPDVKVA